MIAQYDESMMDRDPITPQDFQQLRQFQWRYLEALSISVSQLSLALVARDETGMYSFWVWFSWLSHD